LSAVTVADLPLWVVTVTSTLPAVARFGAFAVISVDETTFRLLLLACPK
jgi:hypothetical protein